MSVHCLIGTPQARSGEGDRARFALTAARRLQGGADTQAAPGPLVGSVAPAGIAKQNPFAAHSAPMPPGGIGAPQKCVSD